MTTKTIHSRDQLQQTMWTSQHHPHNHSTADISQEGVSSVFDFVSLLPYLLKHTHSQTFCVNALCRHLEKGNDRKKQHLSFRYSSEDFSSGSREFCRSMKRIEVRIEKGRLSMEKRRTSRRVIQSPPPSRRLSSS